MASAAGVTWPADTPAYTLPFNEYEDDGDEDGDEFASAREKKDEKERMIRRRSSKACDQCRKSKCKCERSGDPPGAACRACVLVGTDCTFLGPSRKRGPPKGYIDAIEARLHQTEALVAILIAAARGGEERSEERGSREEGGGGGQEGGDGRARGVLRDLGEDPLARAILARIDQSAYGPAGRGLGSSAAAYAPSHGQSQRQHPNSNSGAHGRGQGQRGRAGAGEEAELGSTHPSHEWMDRVTAHLLRRARERGAFDAPPRQFEAFDAQGRAAFEHSPARAAFEHSPARGAFERSPAGSGTATPNGNPGVNGAAGYRYAAGYAPPQRPAIVIPHGHGRGPPHSAGGEYLHHPAYALDGPAGRAFPLSAGAVPDARRLRRRVDSGEAFRDAPPFLRGPPSSGSFRSPRAASPGSGSEAELDVDVGVSVRGDGEGGEDGQALAGAVGQLSLNEDRQVRYHGKASGLHLLARRAGSGQGQEGQSDEEARGRARRRAGRGAQEGEDEEVGKNVGGIWRFPKARVWPATPAADAEREEDEGEVDADGLPPRAAQEALLARYFLHVHPSFPVLHKRAVLEGFAGAEGKPRPPPLLLLAMYALAARHAPQPAAHPAGADRKYMWPAGDAFLFRAKALLDSSYASSRASTCQALLLMGFREIGIGAMAQAWIYIGMAVRMAQDLGMQRDADGWVRVGGARGEGGADGGAGAGGDGEAEGPREDRKLFSEWEIEERRRTWYACVIMDKYVSTYIGRPLAIFERDFDTSLPSECDAEEMEEWAPLSTDAAGLPVRVPPRPGHVISCFNASARLSGILSQIVQSIYALRPPSSRHAELIVLDGLLDKWLLSLPVHLRHDPAVRAGGEVPLPQVLTLHMQYWCAVLLLHRPFIRQHPVRNKQFVLDPLVCVHLELMCLSSSPAPEESDVRGNAEKSYELCAGAANHITTIARLYSETHTLKHCPVFHCYYIFTASIMHVTSLSAYPTDPQARMGLAKCMDGLREMEIIWPAAARALELLRGAQATLADADVASSSSLATEPLRPRKRSATQSLDDTFAPPPGAESFLAMRPFAPVYQENGHYGLEARAPAYYPPPAAPYERWPVEGAGAGLAFQSALSTAVMGPAYSTGLVDDRHRAPPHDGGPRFGQQQYWEGEYAPFPQLGAGYGALQDPAGLAVHPAEPSQIYPLHDQYNLYTQP
ncbi:fungal-specific transcription factor domain-containing protein [Mycena maculata]|uniref:Fungal-specific transcription factor domain-containing protein n=1 Tax=Mycena maculata TaxID=230809 RepID=A0AAD7JPP9_9AGAR|nr:fungal-specific transcription factor domain-containing protein [Mycena maculata]